MLGYEEHIWRAFLGIYDGPDVDIPGQICSTVSLVATADHQVIYYDHWEDGYEGDLLNPVQPSTEIYGDHDPDNGGTGNDILLAGDDVNLTSDLNITGPTAINGYVPVNPSRNRDDIRYDGGDRILSSGGPVDLAHAMWPIDHSWIGGAWEIYSRQAHTEAYSYRLPIGEDLYEFGGGDSGTYGDFRNVYLQLGAYENGTIVLINNGTDVVDLALDQGQTYSSLGYRDSTPVAPITINSGTTIRSNKPVQVGLVTGADSPEGAGFQGRFLMVLSDLLWGADYVVPVPSGGPGNQAEVYLSNPNDFPIRVNAYDAVTQTTFVISPSAYISSTVPYSQKRGGEYVPPDSAVRFTSSDGVFGVVVTGDTSDLAYDWGFSGIPAKYLTRDYYVSWAPGNACNPPDDPACRDEITSGPAVNGSPVWVTPLADETTFYVDFSPLDGIVDGTFTLDVLQQRRIFDPDYDNTGTHVWATSEFAMSWGEDPRTAGTSVPYLDLGLTTLPLLQRWLDPVLTLDKTASPTVLPSAGGTVTFTLVAHGFNSPLTNVDITDTLPFNWAYVPASTHVTYPNGSSESPEPVRDGRTLFWDLSRDLDVNQSLTLTFQAQITNTGGVDVTAFDGFESSTYDGGANWASDWQEEGDDGLPESGAIVITDVAPFVGSHSLRIAGNSRSISRMIDLSDFISPILNFSWRVDELASSDHFHLDVHDGIDWTTVLTWTAQDPQGDYIQEMVDLTPYASATTVIRLRSGEGVAGEGHFYADQVQVYDGIAVSVNRGEAVGKDEYSNTLFSPTDEAAVYINSFDLTKSVSSTRAEIGDTLVYTLSYANSSTFVSATHVSLYDAVPIQHVAFQSASDGGVYYPDSGAIVWSLGTLPSGAGGVVSFTVRVNDFVEDGTVIENVAYIVSDQAQAGSNQVRTTVLSPDVQFYKSGPVVAARGQVITYTLFCQNVGGSEATEVLISDAVPGLTTYVPGSLAIDTGGGWVALSDAVDGDQGAFILSTLVVTPGVNAGTIAPGEVNQIRFSVQIEPGLPSNSLILNSATLDRNLDIPRDSNTVVTHISDLLLSKAAGQAVVSPGGVISYTLAYENASETVAQTDVYVLEPIPSYTSFVAGTAYGGDQIEYSWDHGLSWSTTLPITPVTHLRWYDAIIPPGSQATLGFAVQVNATLPPNTTLQNMAYITSTETAAYGWLASNQVEVETVDLWIEKRADLSVAQANDWVSYTLSYGNHGSTDVSGVQIHDALPSSTTYRAGSIWGVGADDSGEPNLVWNVGTVAAGASAQEVGYAVVLNSDLTLGAVVTNTATLSSVYGVETSEPVTVVITGPDITVSPEALTATLDTGATTTRALTIGNVGEVDLIWSLAEAPAVAWLDEAPAGGTVPPSGSDEVTLVFDATGLTAGVYATTLQVSSNDSDELQVNVPITLIVRAPDITASPGALTVTLDTGVTTTRALTVGNEGEANLTWSLAEAPTVAWLDEAPTDGTVPPSGSDEVTLIFDATDLAAGTYTTTLQINSNDPAEPQVNVPVNLIVQAPDVVVSPDALMVPLVVDGTTTRVLTVSNVGAADLTWSLAEAPAVTWLDEAPMSGTVPAPGSDEVTLTFDARGLVAKVYTTTLQINTNDPDQPQVNVLVTLHVLPLEPDIEVNPDILTATLGLGDTITRTLTVSNVGGVDLIWDLAENPAVPWLDEAPVGGTLPPWSSSDVTFTFTAIDLTVGVYTTTLQVNSNDPHEPWVTVPVTLSVLVPDIEVNPATLAVSLGLNDTTTRTFTIGNAGRVDLIWSLEAPVASWLDEAPAGGTVVPLGSDEVTLTFDATDLITGVYTTTLRVNSNDPDEPQVDVPITLGVPGLAPEYRLYFPLVARRYNPYPSLSLAKSAYPPEEVYAGTRLRYSLQVSNAGSPANDLVVSDVLPAHTTFSDCDCMDALASSHSVPFTCALEGDQVVWRVDEMAGGHSLMMTLWVTVDAGLSDGALIVNDDYSVVANGVAPLSGPPVTTTVRQLFLSVSKTASPNPVVAGHELVFTITVANGGGLLTEAEVIDLLPDGVSYVPDSCEGGQACRFYGGDEPQVRWWLGDLPSDSEWKFTMHISVTDVPSDTFVNESYGVCAKSKDGTKWCVMGEPLEIRVLHPLADSYDAPGPFVLPGFPPWLPRHQSSRPQHKGLSAGEPLEKTIEMRTCESGEAGGDYERQSGQRPYISSRCPST